MVQTPSEVPVTMNLPLFVQMPDGVMRQIGTIVWEGTLPVTFGRP